MRKLILVATALSVALFSLALRIEALTWSDLLKMLSTGEAAKYSTTNFDLHFTSNCAAYPDDCIDLSLVKSFGTILEDARQTTIKFGFEALPHDHRVFFLDIGPNGQSGPMSAPNPVTSNVETWQHMEIRADVPKIDPTEWNLEPSSVGAHEYFHLIQNHYKTNLQDWAVGGLWVIEGQAAMVPDKTFADIDKAEEDLYTYAKIYLMYPKNLMNLVYNAALFWTYVTEQYGKLTSEPGYGMDALLEYWKAARKLGSQANELEVFDQMLANLGHPEVTFVDVFKDFVVANYAKDLTGPNVPSKYRYIDEAQPPGPYGKVDIRRKGQLRHGTLVGQDSVEAWQPRYYYYERSIWYKPGDSDTAIVTVNQFTTNDLFYKLLVVRGNDIVRDEPAFTGRNFTRVLTNLDPSDNIVLIVSGLDNIETTPAKYRYFISPGEKVAVDVKLPPNWGSINVGPIDNPGKFLTVVEVADSTGEPIEGLTAKDFTVAVSYQGAKRNGKVIVAAYVGGLYFLEVQAPVLQSGSELFQSLDVTVAGVESGGSHGIRYAKKGEAGPLLDTVLVLDRSGSMKHSEKIEAAKAAARLYVDSLRAGNRLAFVQYDDVIDMVQGLKEVSSIRSSILTKISSITTGNLTAIGGALREAQKELDDNGQSDHSPHIFLLTDGRENQSPLLMDVFSQDIWGKDTRLDVVAIGNDAQVADLETCTLNSDGQIFFAFDPSSGTLASALGNIYRAVAEDVSGEQRVRSREAVGTAVRSLSESVFIDDVEEATVAFGFRCSELLQRPRCPVLIGPNSSSVMWPSLTDVRQAAGSGDYYGHFLWRIKNPAAGQYRLALSLPSEYADRPPPPIAKLEYLFEASVRGPVTLNTYYGAGLGWRGKNPVNLRIGQAVPILAFLSDHTPITGATVEVTITAGVDYRFYETWKICLYDDGAHGDGLPDDGVYANDFTRTSGLGSTEALEGVTYSVVTRAVGRSNQGASFERESTGAFHLVRDPAGDVDGDGLPDVWEEAHELDPNDNLGDEGAGGDPDRDGLSNLEELVLGTSPTDPDTDGGGENDHSEVTHGRDPCMEEDDTIQPPMVRAVAGNERATIRLGARSSHRSLSLYRSMEIQAGYELIAANICPSVLEYIDDGLANEQTYFYRMAATGADGQISGLSAPVSVTPKCDPIRPWGQIEINGGDACTETEEVILKLVGAPDVVEVRLSDSPGFEDAPWRCFSESISWTLPGEGLQLVFAQFRDAAGNVGGAPPDASELPADVAFDSIVVERRCQSQPRELEEEHAAAEEHKRVLFDEYHDERNSLAFARAAEILPGRPECTLFGEFAHTLSEDFTLMRGLAPLSESLLAAYSVVIISAPCASFSAVELEAVGTFVSNGGGLLVLGDSYLSGDINALLAVFGTSFDASTVCSLNYVDHDPQRFHVTDFAADHPVTAGLATFRWDWGCSLLPGPAAKVLMQSNPDTWQDRDGNGLRTASERVGPFVLGAAVEYGKGRVVVLADNPFIDSFWLRYDSNRRFVLNAVSWLSGN